jgi:hypothetical protein
MRLALLVHTPSAPRFIKRGAGSTRKKQSFSTTARPRSWRIGFETRFAWLPQAFIWGLFSGTNTRFSILLCILPRRPLAAGGLTGVTAG